MKLKLSPLSVALTASALVLMAFLLLTRTNPLPETPISGETALATIAPKASAPVKNLKKVAAKALAGDKLENFDRRLDGRPRPALSSQQEFGLNALRKEIPDVQVDFDRLTGSPSYVISLSRFLTNQRSVTPGTLSYEDAMAKVKAFVNSNRALFLHGGEALDAARVSRKDTTAATGLQTVVWHQQAAGLPVFDSSFKANLSKTGEIMTLASTLLNAAEPAAQKYLETHPAILEKMPVGVEQAISLAAANIGHTIEASQIAKTESPNPKLPLDFYTAPGLSTTYAQKVWLPIDATSVRLAWEVTITAVDRGAYMVLIDAEDGSPCVRISCSAADVTPQYRVWTTESPTPMSQGFASAALATGQPPEVAQELVTVESLNATASPDGWIPGGTTSTKGNNVSAYVDRNNNDLPDAGGAFTGTGTDSRTFDFPADLTQNPTAHEASVVNLFYWCNRIHDTLYSLGFTETAGNFQSNNYGRNGPAESDTTDSDRVNAEAQDSAISTATGGQKFNNANFATYADGVNPRMQMYLFNRPTPDRDSCFDAQVIIHEYAHGLSNRLVGGSSTPPINTWQAAGMGEGWGDFYGLALTAPPTANPHANFPFGAYLLPQFTAALGEANYFWGWRRYPYTTNLNVNPLTFKDIDPTKCDPHATVAMNPIFPVALEAYEVHASGEVWCSMLWEARARMIDRYGHAVGNQTMLQLVTDGMKLSPKNPTFVQARNAILLADQSSNSGANYSLLMNAFAKRGLGASAVAPDSSTTTGVTEAFDVIPGVDVTPAIVTITPLSHLQPIYQFSTTGVERVAGTVNEAARVTFQIEEMNAASSRYWNGSAWITDGSTLETQLNTTVTGSDWAPAAGVVLPDRANTRAGAYVLRVRATDNGGNVTVVGIQVNRTSDGESVPPMVQITFPGNNSTIAGLNAILGTASDPPGGSGLTGVISLNIISPLGEYWNGTQWTTTQATVGANVRDDGTWQYTNLPHGGNARTGSGFIVNATAVDWAGNSSVPQPGVTSRQFTVDPSSDIHPPVIQITSMFPGMSRPAITHISGRAFDVPTNTSGLTQLISLTLYQDGDYWNGTAWTPTQTVLTVPVETGDWIFEMPTGVHARPGMYSVSVTAHDYAGNSSVPQPNVTSMSFFIDASPPTGSITAPLEDAQVPAFPAFTGTASDSNSGINQVLLFIRRERDFKYWNGTGWTNDPYEVMHPTDYNPGTGMCTKSTGLPQVGVNSIGGDYTYTMQVIDNGGNTVFRTARFTVTYQATFTWTGAAEAGNNLWADPGNWSSIFPNNPFIPGEQDLAVIPTGTATVFPGENFSVRELHMTGGTFTGNQVTVLNAFQMFSGVFNGALNLTPNTLSVWNGGRVTGIINIQAGATLEMPGGTTKYLGAAGKPGTINNAGTMVWSSGYRIVGHGNTGGEATINNLPTGVFDVTWAGDPFDYEASPAGCVFNNQGRYVRSSGSGVSSFAYYWTFNNETGAVIECTPVGATIVHNGSQPMMLETGSVFRGAGTIVLSSGLIQTQAGGWIIDSGAVLDINGATIECPQVGSLTPAVAAGSELRWSSGRITGQFDIAAGVTLQMPNAGSSYKYLGAAGKPGTINNAGTMVWSSGYRITGHGNTGGEATINNLPTGVFDVTWAGDPFDYEASPAGCVFNNQGCFVRSGGTGISSFAYYWTFNNETGAVIECTPVGATIAHSGSQPMMLKAGSVFRGAGTIALSSGVIQTPAGSWIIENGAVLDINGATIECPQVGSLTPAVAAGSELRWSSGRITGQFDIPAGVTLQMPNAGSSYKYLGAAGKPGTINNAGTMVWSSGYPIYGRGEAGGEATINNLPTGTFDVTRDAIPLDYEASAAGCVFNNQGYIIKSAGGGTSALNYYWTLNNSGQAGSLSGVLSFPGTAAFNAGSVFNSGFGGSCAITGGTATFRGASLILGGPLVWQGGTVAGHADGTATVNGGILDWSGSTIAGTLTFGSTANVQASGGGYKTLAANAVLRNAGILTWLGGYMSGNGNATLENLAGGTFQAPAGGYLDYNSSGNVFSNKGTFRVGGVGGATGAVTFSSGWAFAQTSTGQLHLDLGGTSTSAFDRILCSGSATLNGTLNITLVNNFVPAIAQTFAVMTHGSRTGAFSIFNSPGAFFTRTYNPNDLTLTTTGSPATLAEWKSAYFDPNSPAAADDADPDGDGVPNLMEYATADHPLSPAPAETPLSSPNGGFVEFHYTRNSVALAELTFLVEWSDGLTTGTWSAAGVSAPEVVSSNGNVQIVKVLVPTGGNDHRFVRLKVTIP